MLWIMKPTIRNEPSVSWPNANDVPIASPSPKLCRPIPIATSVARATPPIAPPALPEKRPEMNVIVRKLPATPSSTSPGPPSAPGTTAWSSNASNSASTPRKVSSPPVRAMNAVSHCCSTRRSDGSQSRPSATGQHADEEADDRVAEEAAAGHAGRLDRGGDLLDRLDPGRARHADA